MGNPGILDSHRAKAHALRAELAIIEAELRGMEMFAASLPDESARSSRPLAPYNRSRTAKRAVAGKFGGKQPGQISARWQETLRELYNTGGWFNVQTAGEFVELTQERIIRATEIRRLFSGYVEHGFLRARPDGFYQVTESAAERFDFPAREGGHNGQLGLEAVTSSPKGETGGATPPAPEATTQ